MAAAAVVVVAAVVAPPPPPTAASHGARLERARTGQTHSWCAAATWQADAQLPMQAPRPRGPPAGSAAGLAGPLVEERRPSQGPCTRTRRSGYGGRCRCGGRSRGWPPAKPTGARTETARRPSTPPYQTTTEPWPRAWSLRRSGPAYEAVCSVRSRREGRRRDKAANALFFFVMGAASHRCPQTERSGPCARWVWRRLTVSEVTHP